MALILDTIYEQYSKIWDSKGKIKIYIDSQTF